MKHHELEVGSGDVIVLDKLFGPAIFANLRITVDSNRGWVIERQRMDTNDWVEQCVIPAQYDGELDSD